MATAASPLGFDPLGSADSPISPLTLLSNAGRNRPDEDLAFATGLMKPSNNGTSGALANAFGAELELRTKKDELMQKYLPLIQQAMQQRYEGTMLGATYAPPQQQAQAAAPGAPSAPAGGGAPAAGAAPSGQPTGGAPVVSALSGGDAGASDPSGASFMNRVLNGTFAQAVQADMFTGGRYGFATAWKTAHEGLERKAGSYYESLNGGPTQYFPKLPDGFQPDGHGGAALAPGFGAAQGQLSYVTTKGQEGAKDEFAKPEPVDTPQGVKLMTPAQQRAYAGAPNPNASSPNALGGNPALPAPMRNNNPGALMPGGKLAQYDTPEAGLNALDQNLQNYAKQGLNTVASVISKWAPPNENDTASYIKNVAATMGVAPDAPLDMNNPVTRHVLAAAIIKQENGPSAFVASGNSQPGNSQTPNGGTLRSPEQKAYAEDQAKKASDYKTGLEARVQQGAEMNMRLQEQLDTLEKFRAGGGGQTREQLAQMAQAIPGVPKWVVNGIAGGDLAAMQEFQKLAAQTAMEQLKQSMGGAGRVSQYEFKVFADANPNLSTDPEAIKKVAAFNTRLYQRDLQEQQAFDQWTASGRDPTRFQAEWQKELAKRGFTKPDMKPQTSGFTAAPSAAPTQKFAGFSATVKGQ